MRWFVRANNGIFAGDYSGLDIMDTENDLELKQEVEEKKFHRMAMVHNFLEI